MKSYLELPIITHSNIVLFDATHDADTTCLQCGIQLTRSNCWSSWLCIDCHDAEMNAKGEYRPMLLEAMRRYNQPKFSNAIKAISFFLLLSFGGIVYLRKKQKKDDQQISILSKRENSKYDRN